MDEPIPPYTYGEEGEYSEKGITKEIFDELFGRLGISYVIRLVPWARAIDSVKHGRADGIPLLMEKKEREAFLAYSAPVVENRELFYYLPGRLGGFSWDEYADLKQYTIGLVRGYTYAEDFLAAIKEHSIPVRYFKDATMSFRMLEAGRVDLVLEDESVAEPHISARPELAGRVVPHPKQISSYYWYIGVHRQSPLALRMDDINATLEDMRTDGSLARILDKR